MQRQALCMFLALLALLCLAVCDGKAAQVEEGRPPRGGHQQGGYGPPPQPVPVVPEHALDIILGRPGATTVTCSLLATKDMNVVVAYGVATSATEHRTKQFDLRAQQPQDVVLQGLRPDTSHAYTVLEATTRTPVATGMFHTQRATGTTFTFTVTADSHLDQNTDTELYQQTLKAAGEESPEFHIDLGDTFMTGKHQQRADAALQYMAQRYYLGQLAKSAPLFLVLGNHDGEEARQFKDGEQSLGQWATHMRMRYFPNPVPDGFYTGNARTAPQGGALQDYYAWEWGDALFVVLDAYRYASPRNDDIWSASLGLEQYQWLKRTLTSSKARYKCIFIHQLVGGVGRQGRGGTEAAVYGEWGGKNSDGSLGFARFRPGWDMPIHDLLVQSGVTLVFHGHDHLYARQALDGIIYQAVPQPGFPRSGPPRHAEEYGYTNGVILGGAGYLLVTVAPHRMDVTYKRMVKRAQIAAEPALAQSADTYTIALP